MSRRAFVLFEDSKVPYQTASAWGTVTAVFPRGMEVSCWDLNFAHQVLRRLDKADYRPHEDAIVVVGSSVAIVQVIAAVVAMYGAPIIVLVWSVVERRYVERSIGARA